MSTRCSIIYDYGIHLYLECLDGNVCLEGNWNPEYAEFYGVFIDSKNGDAIVPRAKLIEWRDALTKIIEENPEPGSQT